MSTLPNADPTVSVVMPVYNTEAYLTDSIDSIVGQTFPDWELICVDDGSSDGSLEILRCYERADSRVRVITRSHSGNYRARNAGMALARGRYIAAMDSDDGYPVAVSAAAGIHRSRPARFARPVSAQGRP